MEKFLKPGFLAWRPLIFPAVMTGGAERNAGIVAKVAQAIKRFYFDQAFKENSRNFTNFEK